MKRLLSIIIILISINSFAQTYAIEKLAMGDTEDIPISADFVDMDGYVKIKKKTVEFVLTQSKEIFINKYKIVDEEKYYENGGYFIMYKLEGKKNAQRCLLFVNLYEIQDRIRILLIFRDADIYLITKKIN